MRLSNPAFLAASRRLPPVSPLPQLAGAPHPLRASWPQRPTHTMAAAVCPELSEPLTWAYEITACPSAALR
jgi:hypothetical protein